MILPAEPAFWCLWRPSEPAAPFRPLIGFQWLDDQSARIFARLSGQPDLNGLASQLDRNTGLEGPIKTGDRNEFGFEAGTQNSRIVGAAGPSQRAPTQGCVDVDAAVRDHFGARVHGGENYEIPAARIDLLARA